MSGTSDPPCGVPAHRMGWWDDEVLGIWWCPDCHEEIWATEGAAGDERTDGVGAAPRGAEASDDDGRDVPVPAVRSGATDAGHVACAPRDRAPSGGAACARVWHLIVDRYGR